MEYEEWFEYNAVDLYEKFVDQPEHKEAWLDFVEEEHKSYLSGLIDVAHDRYKDSILDYAKE